MHKQRVEKRRWISERRFLHALNYCMLLPGPEAQQLAANIGWLMHRAWGGVIAGALIVLSWLYIAFGDVCPGRIVPLHHSVGGSLWLPGGGRMAPAGFAADGGRDAGDKYFGPAVIDGHTPISGHALFRWGRLSRVLFVGVLLWASPILLLVCAAIGLGLKLLIR